MKTEYWLFIGGMLFFIPLGFVYGVLTHFNEPVGTVAICLTGGLGLLVGSYLFVTSRRVDPRPEDDLLAEIADGAGEQGEFAPHSWWPLGLALPIAISFLGFAIGPWLILIGGTLAMLALVGWVFEFYRGAHAH